MPHAAPAQPSPPGPSSAPSATPHARPVRVWDLPTRLFHWSLASCVAVLVVTGNVGGNAMVWHFRVGAAVGALLLFRLAWGVVGGRWSRFASFVYRPATLLRYLRGGSREAELLEVGHSPLGALSVFALLGLLLLQVGTGLFADDEIASVGPLNQFVASHWANLATGWHKGYGKTLIYALVLLHIAAVGYYLLRKRRNLIAPMLHGDKALPASTPASRDGWRQRVLAALLMAGFAALATWVYRLGG